MVLQAINNFCRELGITRSDSMVHLHKLDFHVRADLDVGSPRCLAVLDPLRLTLANLPDDFFQNVSGKVQASLHHAPHMECLTQDPAWKRWRASRLLTGAAPVLH